MKRHPLVDRLRLEHPIILAPMAGGPSTPELVAAVSSAGGLGSLGAAYLSRAQIADAVARVRALSRGPVAVNLFSGGYDADAPAEPGPVLELLAIVHARLGIAPPTVPAVPPDPFPEQVEAILEARPEAFSFTFGIPPADVLARMKARGIATLGTATTVAEARQLEAAGVDAVIAQGGEAGGHRGTFGGPFGEALVPLLELVAGCVAAVQVPVIAAGGLMDGRDIARALERGAVAGMLGTAFLPCPECGAFEPFKRAVLAAKGDPTVVTRAFSGRPARGIRNGFIRSLEGRESLVPPYPLQNLLTRPMRTAAAKAGEADFLSLWAGRGVARARALPAGELVRQLVLEMSARA